MATKIVLNKKNAKVWLWNLSIQSSDSNGKTKKLGIRISIDNLKNDFNSSNR